MDPVRERLREEVYRGAIFAAVTIAAILLFLALSGCTAPVIDLAMSAEQGNEPTVVLSGCGESPSVGFLGVKATVGGLADCVVVFHVEDARCSRDSCVAWQTWRMDGTPGPGGGIPKGGTEGSFTIKDLLGDERFLPGHDGRYLFRTVAWFDAADGTERAVRKHGYIVLAVQDANYVSVGCRDPARAWSVRIGRRCDAEMTTAGRVALCGPGCR